MSWLLIETVGFSLTLGSPCIWKAATILGENSQQDSLFQNRPGDKTYQENQGLFCHIYGIHPLIHCIPLTDLFKF